MYGDKKANKEKDSKEWVARVERNTELFYDLCPCYMIGTSDSPSYLASLERLKPECLDSKFNTFIDVIYEM